MYPILHDQYVTDFVETRRQSAARFGTRESNTVRFIAWASCRLGGHATNSPARYYRIRLVP